MTLRDFRVWGLAPAVILMTLTLVIPIGIVALVSFSTRGAYGGFEWDLSGAAYTQVLFQEGWTGGWEFNPQYLAIVGRTLVLAALTTLICILVSFPVAYAIAQTGGRTKAILIYLITLPFWVSMIVRVYAWIIILGNDGIVVFKNKVKKQLIAVQKDGPTADFTAKDWNIVRAAKFQVNLLL